MNEQQYLCPWCRTPLDIEPVKKQGREFVRLYCPNGNCMDPAAPIKNTITQARAGAISTTIEDAYQFLKIMHGGAPEGCFGMAR